MKYNRLMWGLVSVFVVTTITMTWGGPGSYSQEIGESQAQPTPSPNSKFQDQLTKYAVTDYNARDPEDAGEREERRLKGLRYDNEDWVLKNPHPNDGGVGRYDEMPPPPLMPSDESDLVIVGTVTSANAFLSNDKEGIYTEFAVRVNQILKNRASNRINQGQTVTADRAGGIVVYPNRQKVLYKNNERDLPTAGGEYVLFLTCDNQSPNYRVLAGYELKEGNVSPLEFRGAAFDEYKGTNKTRFIKAIQDKIAISPQPPK